MPLQDLPSPALRPAMNGRTSSAQSLSYASPSGGLPSTSHKAPAHKLHRAHTHALGRLPHTRNPSYGKNLNKLTKLNATHGGDEGSVARNQSRQKLHTPSTSPSIKDIRRNVSNVSLPRVASKPSVKRNSSNVSLKRNGSSATQLGKAGRPVTPLRNSHTNSKTKHNTSANAGGNFSVGSDEDQDEDWTEESNSQSPSTTRQSSEGVRTRPGSPPPMSQRQAVLPDSPPESPATTSSTEAIPEPLQNPQAMTYSNYASTRPPDADAVTSRLLRHHASQKLQPQLSSISATGTPGTHTPPIYASNDNSSTDPSMPTDGVSRFLNHNVASGSSGGSIAHLHSALSALQSPASAHNTRTRSPSPNPSTVPAESVRRAKSTGNLTSASTTPNTVEPGKRAPPSYSIDPRATRRSGGNTAAKQELWRTQVNIENPAPHAGPGLAIRGPPGLQGMLGTEERRIRLWERAEGEMGYLRRFRNPVLEGVGRMVGGKGKRRRKGDGPEGIKKEDERGRTKDGRPGRQKGERRSVRFEVGGDGAGEEGGVEGILRRLWEGEEGGYAGLEQ